MGEQEGEWGELMEKFKELRERIAAQMSIGIHPALSMEIHGGISLDFIGPLSGQLTYEVRNRLTDALRDSLGVR